MQRRQLQIPLVLFLLCMVMPLLFSCSPAGLQNYRYGVISYDSLENKVHFTGLNSLMEKTKVKSGPAVNFNGFVLAQRSNYYFVMDMEHLLFIRYRLVPSGLELAGTINMKDIPWEPYMSWVNRVDEKTILLGTVNKGKFSYIEIDLEAMNIKRLGALEPPTAPKDNNYVGVSAELTGDKLFVQYTYQKGMMRQHILPCDDTLHVAQFSYPELKLEKTTKNHRTTWPGSYTIMAPASLVYKGAIYSLGQPGGRTGNHTSSPSAVLKLNPSTGTFDKDYFLEVANPKSAEAYMLQDLGHGMALSSVVETRNIHSFRNYMVNRVANYVLLDLVNQRKIQLDLPAVPLDWIFNTLQEGDHSYLSVYQDDGNSQIWEYSHQTGKLKKGTLIPGSIIRIDHL